MTETTERKVAKIIGKDESNLYTGVVEGMQWKVVGKPFASSEPVSVGQYVYCYVLYDEKESEYYLEQDIEKSEATEAAWQEQEKQSE